MSSYHTQQHFLLYITVHIASCCMYTAINLLEGTVKVTERIDVHMQPNSGIYWLLLKVKRNT